MNFRIQARGEGDLKTRYRPQRLNEICPTFNLKDAQSILSDPNASQVWLFEGVTGCGKTTLARIIARAAVCESEGGDKPCLECPSYQTMESSGDYIEVNGADYRGIDDMRRITSDMGQYPFQLSKRIVIFDEAQQITRPGQELLNKELEEPSESTLIFLLTTNKKGLIRTLLGRCAKLNFRRLASKQAVMVSNQVLQDLGLEMLDKDTHEDMFRRADGSVRDFLNLLDSHIRGTYRIGSENVDTDVHEGSPDIFALVKGLIQKNWPEVRKILKTENVKNDPDGYRETVCSFLARDALDLRKCPEDTPKMSIAQTLNILSDSLWEQPKREQYSIFVMRCMKACMRKG
jgi:DNA polymerase III gamma/tau subunit